jgi:hypothetical protein
VQAFQHLGLGAQHLDELLLVGVLGGDGHHRLDDVAEGGRRDLGVVAADDAGRLHLLDALRRGRQRQPGHLGQRLQRGAGVFLQGGQDAPGLLIHHAHGMNS